jgi:hypothetical protein
MPFPKLHKDAALSRLSLASFFTFQLCFCHSYYCRGDILCGGGDGHEESDFHLSKIQDSTGNRQDFKLFPAAVLGRAVIGLL